MEASQEESLARLVFLNRWGALATVHNNQPLASYVAYAVCCEGQFLLHLSQLAEHTGNLLKNPQASLSMSDVDCGAGDPQTLTRVTLKGDVEAIPRGSSTYSSAQAEYLENFPEAQQRFSFADFVLFKFVVEEVRFVAGFGRAFTLSAETLWRVRRDYLAAL